ncbi:MAG: S8 family serine peptidase [Microbacterium sp.]|uniref:S8/S53 family peptidase n=1 Tax=Microbacterium sp. TaxID=51671 RepID=UPI001AC71B20|nr:S8/S53 family peptidase [Microbacterium sp.]MBN9177613.1 S8 family serine peptidase [Microbacterium sp.]
MTLPRSLRRGVPALALSLVASIALAPAAVAATAEVDGNWWYQKYGVAEVQAEGWNGAGVKIAVIDQKINDQLPVFSSASVTVAPPVCDQEATTTEVTDASVHGSSVTALLVGNGEGNGAVKGIVPAADVTFYALGDDYALCRNLEDDRSGWALALDAAVAAGADIVTMSVVNKSATDDDAAAVARALKAGVIFVAGVPNEPGQGDFPAGMNGVVSVNGFDRNGDLLTTNAGNTNVQPEVTVVAPGAEISIVAWDEWRIAWGSSSATPMVAGILAAAKQKYPDATANQLIQSLIHNTRTEDHPLERDTTGGYGYGPASLRHILAVDPTQYPDENPLMDKTYGQPTVAQVSTPTPSAGASSPAPAPGGEASAPDQAGAASPLGWILGGVGAVVLAGAIITVIAVTRRKQGAQASGAETKGGAR